MHVNLQAPLRALELKTKLFDKLLGKRLTKKLTNHWSDDWGNLPKTKKGMKNTQDKSTENLT